MGKESIKRMLATIRSFFIVARIKLRYRSVIIAKRIIVHLRRFCITLGRTLLILSTALAVNTAKITKSFTITLGQLTKQFILKLFNLIKNNKKKVAFGCASLCVVAFCGVSVFNAVTAYQYSYDGEVLGVVEEPSCVYKGIEKAEQTLTDEIGAKVVIDKDHDIQVKRVLKENDPLSAEEDVVNALTSIETIKVVAYEIVINDDKSYKLVVSSADGANQVLDSIKKEFLGEYSIEEYSEITFEEDVQIEDVNVELEEIITTKEAFKIIKTGGIEEKIHKVKVGDSVSSIAEKYKVARSKLKKWNPEIKEDNILWLNQEIQLREQIPLVNVITTRNTTFNEDYGPEIIYEDTDNLYKGQEIVSKEGISGNRTVNADIIEKNGKQIDRVDHSYTVHKKQVASNVMRGTREKPQKIGKGYYLYPMNGNFSSPFGARWGRVHEGMDISGPIGTPIYAADAGVVKEAGATTNGYGIAVKIEHDKGRETYYAHNSKVLVKVGDLVYRGQQIAESGNTGASTGPHLHFETIFNGVKKNPQKYL